MFLMGLRIKLARFVGHRYRRRGAHRIVRSLYGPPYHSSHPAIETSVISRSGARYLVNTRSLIEWRLFAFGEYEEELQNHIVDHLSKGTVFVDCGANIGIHTCAIAQRFPNARVIAIEPVDHIRDRLRANIELNCLSNVEVVPMAVGDRTGHVEIFLPRKEAPNQGQASLSKRGYLDPSGVVVPIDTLDNIVASIESEPISVIKMDVEGQELQVLRNAGQILSADRPTIFFEFDPDVVGVSDVLWDPIEETLKEVGYEVTGTVVGGLMVAEPIESE